MRLSKKGFAVAFFPVFLFTSSVFAQKNKPSSERRYINNDSTGTFSTNPSRPFMYGYALSKKECEEDFGTLLAALNPKKGEKIAEVGAASGWVLGALSVFTDSITYYVQDIDPHYSNQEQMDKMVAHYSHVRGTPQTNSFYFVLGDMQSTHLPDNTFDKVLINNSFHEMTKADEMIADMKKKLVPGGVIVINEAYANSYRKVKHGGCNIKARTVDQMNLLFEKQGLYLVKASTPLNSVMNVLFYSTDKAEHERFMQKVQSVKTYTDILDELNKDNISKDSLLTVQKIMLVQPDLEKITAVFPDTENYLGKLASEYIDEKKFIQAAHVSQAYTIAYPHLFDAWDWWGDALMQAEKYQLAAEVYSKAIGRFPERPGLYEARSYVLSEMDSLENALKCINKAIELGGKDLSDYYGERALVYKDMELYEEAMEDFEKSIKLNPKNGETYFDRAEMNEDLENFVEAIADYSRIIEIDPENGEAYYKRALAKRMSGDRKGYDADMALYKKTRKK
jgi:tetratricopeptide (TPR) repeat protein